MGKGYYCKALESDCHTKGYYCFSCWALMVQYRVWIGYVESSKGEEYVQPVVDKSLVVKQYLQGHDI